MAASIRESTGSSVDVVQLELMDLDSVRACAQGWLASHGPLNLLINNAGIMACPLDRTDAGWEIQFASNHLGHFQLRNGLVSREASTVVRPPLRDGAE